MFTAATLAFPALDPVAFEIGPLAVRWYALAYIVGLLLAWMLARRLARRPESKANKTVLDDALFYATLGVVLGGRLGYVIFYKPGYFLENPAEIVQLWQGGMSFHGGLIGVLLAIAYTARKHKLHFFDLADIVGVVTPIGLCLGRLANFVNGELYGRVTDVSWGMVFPSGGPEPRHPSQLYQSFLEGPLLLLFLLLLVWRGKLATTGWLSGFFLIGYAIARLIGELFREPDAHLGFILGPVTMGQLLSLPMLAAGLLILRWSKQRAAKA